MKSEFCRKWKFSKLSPRLKSQELNKMLPSSYRPVAILSTTSKIIERAAQTQLSEFFEKNKLFNPSNHAYRKHLSTATTLTEITDELYESIEKKNIAQIMTLDQTAAFDCVSFEILLGKLERYKIGQEARNWIRDYLTGRTQFVEIGTSKSRMETVRSGVPQGSVIGPFLYAIYTNELTQVIKSPDCNEQVHQDRESLFGRQCRACGVLSVYADDITYTVSNKKRDENQVRIQRNLTEISDFLIDNSLLLNLPKTSLTEVMIMQKKSKTIGEPPRLTVTDGPSRKLVKDKITTRILGANLHCNMTWQTHLETGPKALLPIVRRQLGHLRHIGSLIPLKSRMNLASSLIVSRLNYLLPLWGGAADCHLNRAQILVNAAARWATGAGKRIRISELMERTGWLTLREQAFVATAVQTWKLVHYGTPARLLESMWIEDDLEISVERPRLLFSENSYRWRATRQWNEIPSEIRQTVSISSFKKQLKRHIKELRFSRANLERAPD